jgi:hypothetical protein
MRWYFATPGCLTFALPGGPLKLSIFCDHGHEIEPSSRWTFVDNAMDDERGAIPRSDSYTNMRIVGEEERES